MTPARTRIREHIPSLALAVILAYQLFVPPSVGLANNNDFAKIIGSFSLGAPAGHEYQYVDLTYQFDPSYHWQSGFYSSESMLAAAAIGLNRIFSKSGSFDLRWMGLIHGLLFMLAVYLAESLLATLDGWRYWFLWLTVAVVFGDVMYVSYLNSFYMDAAAYLFLMLAGVLFLRAAIWHRKSDAVWLVICLALLLLSKSQHAILSVWLAPLFAFFGAGLWPRNGRWFAIGSTAVITGAAILSADMSPIDYAPRGYYSVIFFQVLPHSKNMKADLEALGLDESYARLAGTHAYSAASGFNDPAFLGTFMQRTSYSRLGWYFLTHPRDASLALQKSLDEGGRQRPPMGNFDRNTGFPPFTEAREFAFWSNAKRGLFHFHGVRYLIYFVSMAALICGIATAQRTSLPSVLVAGIYALAGMGLTEMLVAALADAIDITRHYFIAGTILDLELLIVLWMLINRLNYRVHAESPQQQKLR